MSSVYFHWSVLDGPSNDYLKFYVEIDDRAVDKPGQNTYTFDSNNNIGDRVWYNEYSYNTSTKAAQNFKNGTITIKVYDAYTMDYLGEKTVHMHN